MPDFARNALTRIDGEGRQWLALRGYLRARGLDERWSWSDEQISAYSGSPEALQAQAAVSAVQQAFAEANPGYALRVNMRVRSLDEQLRKWNANASVGIAADALAVEMERRCGQREPDNVKWLRNWRPSTPVNLAVPGLSAHGQGRAYDFQVMQDDTLIAGTDSRRVETDWLGAGWAKRLSEAVRASGQPFDGPLRSPREPWHFSYRPEP